MKPYTKRKVSVAAAILVLFGGTTIAHANPDGVTIREFFRVEKNWSKARVEKVFEVSGDRQSRDLASSPQWMTKTYPTTAKYDGYAFIYYERAKKGPWKVKRTYWCPADSPCMQAV